MNLGNRRKLFGSLAMVAGSVLFSASVWFPQILIGRLHGPAELGEFTYAWSIVVPIFTFGNLGMR